MKKNRILLLAILLLALAILLNNFSNLFSNKNRYAINFETVLFQKAEKVQLLFDRLQKADEKEIVSIIRKSNQEGILLVKYKSDSLLFWSSNTIPLNDLILNRDLSTRLISFFDCYYYLVQTQVDSVRYLGLINVYNSYSHENEFLQSGFNEDFKLPEHAGIHFDQEAGYEVRDKDDTYLFSIEIPAAAETGVPGMVLGAVLFFLALILMGLYLFRLLQAKTEKGFKFAYVYASICGILLLRLMQLIFSFNISGFLLFNPFLYAESSLAPSLGDLLVNSLILFFTAAVITQISSADKIKNMRLQRGSLPGIIVFTLLFLFFFLNAHYYSYSLIFNSSISFQPGEVDQLSLHSLVGFLINGINYLSAGLMLIWLFRLSMTRDSISRFIPAFILTTATVFSVLFLFFSYPLDSISLVFFYLFASITGILFYQEKDLSAYSSRVLLLLLFSVYSFIYISLKVGEKEAIIKRSIVLSLANEHDPVAEYLFEGLSQQIEKDENLKELFQQELIDLYALSDYLKKKYFSGFWNKYDMQITLCRPKDSVLIEVPEFEWFHCYKFFDQIIKEVGYSLPDSRFFYLDNLTGRISYLGRFPFQQAEQSQEISLFVELDSKLSTDFLGYPELLLDKKLHEDRLIQGYSYAKYYRGRLVSKFGDFSYSLTADLFGELNNEYSTVHLDDYIHLAYKMEHDSIIILSLPETRFIDLLIGFSYIFLFYYLCLILLLGINNIRHAQPRILTRLRSKIQFSILSILVISLILIAISTVWLNLRNYRQSQLENLQEKVQSVLIELSHKLANQEELTPAWFAPGYDNLDQLLIKFSDVFYTDINLYDLDGNLLATSRFEIFRLGLQGQKMDPTAFFKLNTEKRAQFIHREKIGKLKFLSAYVPFENAEGKQLAYLNLPYFTKQTKLQASLSTLIITIANIYVILILITIVITILISEQITRPLLMLQLKFRELKIGDKYEQIVYKRQDEIGSLVTEYNKMVLELERSVNMLARSERESAWREMAKQIAHEIKNPLTPMRLSVQQLNKIWNEKQEDFEKYLNSVTLTLIEQIDNLSAIASEFSNFAKMPVTKFEEFDLVGVIKKSVHLFDGNNAITLNLTTEARSYPIMGDKEQLSRVFINLIKNGIQSIPENRKGVIDIHVRSEKRKAIVVIKDNGRGIPDDVKPKMFMPNFTTKSSGMGLGLAIVKNVIDQLGGEIDFETRMDVGSQFILHLPLISK